MNPGPPKTMLWRLVHSHYNWFSIQKQTIPVLERLSYRSPLYFSMKIYSKCAYLLQNVTRQVCNRFQDLWNNHFQEFKKANDIFWIYLGHFWKYYSKFLSFDDLFASFWDLFVSASGHFLKFSRKLLKFWKSNKKNKPKRLQKEVCCV